MLNKKNIVKLIFILSIIILVLIGSIYFYRKPKEIHKVYNGIIKDLKTNDIIGDSNIVLDINYQKGYIIKDFKFVDKLNGNINIDDKVYEIEGITILNDQINYIGATASENGNSKYYIFLLDNLESILLGEIGDDRFIKQIVAPAKDESDFNEIINKLP